MAAFWDSNQKTDHSSIEEFLKALDVKVLAMVKVDVASLVRNSLGKAVTKPESTGMYRVLQSIIKRLTVGFTLGRARTITKNEKMKGNGPSQVSIATITVTSVTHLSYDYAIFHCERASLCVSR